MANTYGFQFDYSPIPGRWTLFAKVSIGALGDPTLVTASGLSKYISSIVRNDVGDYTITLAQTYNYFMGLDASFVAPSGAAAPDVSVAAEDVANAKTINILCQAGGVNTDPASGEIMYLEIKLKGSSAF